MFQRHLIANVRDIVVPQAARTDLGNPVLSRIIAWMQAPDGRFAKDNDKIPSRGAMRCW